MIVQFIQIPMVSSRVNGENGRPFLVSFGMNFSRLILNTWSGASGLNNTIRSFNDDIFVSVIFFLYVDN